MGAVEANTLWFTEAGTGVGSGTAIGSMGLDGTIFNETSTPTYDEPWAIAADSSGNMWFTEAEGSAIGEITGLNIKEFPLPMQNTGTYGITIVNSAIWFTEESGALGSLVPSTMTITGFTGLSATGGITLGPDNNIWFLETKKIGSIDPATKTIKELPILGQPNGAASGLVIGTDRPHPAFGDRGDRGRSRRNHLVHGKRREQDRPNLPIRGPSPENLLALSP
jgi:streptogramin lyase